MCAVVILGPVQNVWLDPDSGFSPEEPVTCKADGNPRPTFRWMRASDNETVAVGAKLVDKSANHSYICRAENTVRGQKYIVMSSVVDYNAPDPGSIFDPGRHIHSAISTTLPSQLYIEVPNETVSELVLGLLVIVYLNG